MPFFSELTTNLCLVDIAFNPAKSSLDVSTNTVWVVGRSSAATRLTHQLSSSTQNVLFRQVSSLPSIAQALKAEPSERQQAVFVSTSGFTCADLVTLQSISSANPNVPVAVCFSTARLDLISYALAFNFATYLTDDDCPADCQHFVCQLLNTSPTEPMYSGVFREWLRNYGLLFEHDQTPFRQAEWD